MVDKITLSEYKPKPTLGLAHGEGTQNLLRIGAGSTESGYCSGGNYFFKGNIDEVRVWNKARSQAEIQADMNRPLTGTEANLAGYWRLTDVSGNQVLDLAPNSLNGNICKGSMGQQTIDLPSGLGGKTPEPPVIQPPIVEPPVIQPPIVEPPIVCPPEALAGQIIVPSNAINGVDFTNPTDRELTFTFSPSGNWKPATWADCTAAGWKDFAYQGDMKYPNNNSFALLAVNKQTNTVVAEVAVEMTIVLKPGETLTFLVNDIPTFYDDNTGSLVVNWSAK